MPKNGWQSYFGQYFLWGLISIVLSIGVGIVAGTVVHQKNELIRTINIDPLTRINNRRSFYYNLNRVYKNAKSLNLKFAILFIDVNKFKSINDVYGHTVGDMVLIESANRMKAYVDSKWFLSRFGGDEFIIIIPMSLEQEDLTKIIDQLKYTFIIKPFEFDGQSLDVTISVGHAIYPDDSDDIELLVSKADASMYRDKKR